MKRRIPTQRERVLRALRKAGPRGITAVDFLKPTIDGYGPILRLPARIDELQRQHIIVPGGKRDKCKVYVLAGDRAGPGAIQSESEGSSLFDSVIGRARPASAITGEAD